MVVNSFVAQPQVQSQFRSELPVILCVKGVNLMVIVDVVQIVDAAAIAQSHQEGCESGATAEWHRRVVGESRAEVERAAGRGRLKNCEFFRTNSVPNLKE